MKRINVFSFIIGTYEEKELEFKMMSGILFFVSLANALTYFLVPVDQISEIFRSLMPLQALLSGIGYVLSRFYKKYTPSLFILTFVEALSIFFDWKENGGIKGTLPLTFVTAFLVDMHLYSRKQYPFFLTGSLFYLGLFIYLEVNYSHWLAPSKIDVVSATIHWVQMLLFTSTVVFLFKRNEERRQNVLLKKEKELQVALDKERELNKLKNKFVAMVSHQFRTPMTIIHSSSEIVDITVKKYLPENVKERTDKQFQKIYVAISRITKMMEKVLNFGKMETQQIKFSPIKSDPITFLTEVIESYPVEDRVQKVPLQIKGTYRELAFDPSLIEQCIINLLNNALKFDPERRFPLVICDFREKEFALHVQDKGIGIPSSEINNLFSPFFRANNAKNHSGTGIGLALVKHFTDLHDGIVSVDSKEGQGTTFTIALPYEQIHLQN